MKLSIKKNLCEGQKSTLQFTYEHFQKSFFWKKEKQKLYFG